MVLKMSSHQANKSPIDNSVEIEAKTEVREDTITNSKDNVQEADDSQHPQSLKDMVNLKEILGILVGTIIIISIIIILPQLNIFKEEPKTLAEMHIENFNKKPSETNFIYHGYSFLKLPDPRTSRMFWYTQYKSGSNIYDLPMHFSPLEVENITKQVIAAVPKANYTGIYITVDPMNDSVARPYLTLAVSELTEKFNTVKNYPLLGACTSNETEACKTRAIVNCTSAKTDAKDYIVMYFNDTIKDPKIIIDGNCFTIQGKNEDLVKATDKAIYLFLGIMNSSEDNIHLNE